MLGLFVIASEKLYLNLGSCIQIRTLAQKIWEVAMMTLTLVQKDYQDTNLMTQKIMGLVEMRKRL